MTSSRLLLALHAASTLLLLLSLALQDARAAITAASVTLSTLNAGAASSATVAFTMDASVPDGGAIVVAFPPTFFIVSPVLSSVTGITATTTVSLAADGYTVSIAISGSAVSPGAISFTIDGLTNPGKAL
ncbi:hypothetical protein PINS_up004690 [Pythium insidiosum]|nr:hypothetical protein PINS_up004690 [Pythium insidiosum]